MNLRFSVVTVTLNCGEKLEKTVNSILNQDYSDFEIVIKDGGSTDGSLDSISNLKTDKIRVITCKDAGIYDAMNQAVRNATGDYVIFLNAGDSFYSNDVLSKIAGMNLPTSNTIAYGDTYFETAESVSKAPPVITGSVCYRNIPCHQAIFYSKDTLEERGFDTSYKIRADFEHFAYSFFEANRQFIYLDLPVCNYEGRGFSESVENKKRDRDEYIRAVRKHIPLKKRFVYRLTLILTLHKIRKLLAQSKLFGKVYQQFKGFIYRVMSGKSK